MGGCILPAILNVKKEAWRKGMRWKRLNVYMIEFDDGDDAPETEALCVCPLGTGIHYHVDGESQQVLTMRMTPYRAVRPGVPVPAGQPSLWHDPSSPEEPIDEFSIRPRPPLK